MNTVQIYTREKRELNHGERILLFISSIFGASAHETEVFVQFCEMDENGEFTGAFFEEDPGDIITQKTFTDLYGNEISKSAAYILLDDLQDKLEKINDE
jgi:hypothetical protein